MTSCKDALKKWEESNKTPLEDAIDVSLCFQTPPIQKMDNSLSVLVNCTKLSLSSNQIDKIAGVNSLKNLKILSLARNQIKTLSGIEALGNTLEELWMSYNILVSLKGIHEMKALKVLYIGYNNIKEWNEVSRLSECPELVELLFLGNPLVELMEEAAWKAEVIKRLPALAKLDGDPVIRL